MAPRRRAEPAGAGEAKPSWAAKACARRMEARASTAQWASRTASVISLSDPSGLLMAWLHTRASRWPAAAAACSTTRAGSPGAARSAGMSTSRAGPTRWVRMESMTASMSSAPQGWEASCGR